MALVPCLFDWLRMMNGGMKLESVQTAVSGRPKAMRPPSYLIEYVYYAVLFYGMLGVVLGISIRLIGAGTLAGLAMLCTLHFGARSSKLYGPIALALACAISSLLWQLLYHQETPMNGQLRLYMTWLFSLIVIQALSLRKGFLHRFAMFAFLLGCGTLPYLETYGSSEELTRMGVSHDVALSNPNSFGMWFGFCSVYFLVFGLEAKNNVIRLASWSACVLSLFLVAITVSRGPLLGVAIAAVIAFQKVLKRSFFPILMLFFFAWIIYVTGIFDELIGYYLERGTEESGRTALWREGFNMFIGSWWSGVGISNSLVATFDRPPGPPHNALLYLGIQSGIIPVLFFVGYLGRAGLKAFRGRFQKTSYAPFILPLFTFSLLEIMTLDTVIFSPWTMVVFSAALSLEQDPRRLKK